MGTTESTKDSKPDGEHGGHDVEPVGYCGEPVFEGVGDLFGGSGEGPVSTPAAEPVDDLADGEVLAAREADDERVPALGRLDLVLAGQIRGERPVEVRSA
jgi:hypothetical protein